MDIVGGIAAVGAAVAGAFLVGRGLRAAQDAVVLMFRPSALSWPHGVQEDDDHHWNWGVLQRLPLPPADGDLGDLVRPEVEDLAPGAADVPAHRPVAVVQKHDCW